MQANSSHGKNMEVLIQNKAKNSTKEMDKAVNEAISGKHAPVRISKINMTFSRIASTASWFGTRGKSVNRLLERVRTEKNVNISNHRNETPLIIASQLGAYSFASLILTQKASINIQDEKGYSALHYAIEANTLKVVLELLKKWRRRERTYKKGTPPCILRSNLTTQKLGEH